MGDSPSYSSPVAQHFPRNSRLLWYLALVEQERCNECETNDERREHLCGVPREADTAKCKSDDGERRPGNDDEVTAGNIVSGLLRDSRCSRTYSQSTRTSLARTDPSGVRTFKNIHTKTKAMPVSGRLMTEAVCEVDLSRTTALVTHRIASARKPSLPASHPVLGRHVSRRGHCILMDDIHLQLVGQHRRRTTMSVRGCPTLRQWHKVGRDDFREINDTTSANALHS